MQFTFAIPIPHPSLVYTDKYMTHFGIICPGSTGHTNTITPLGYELQQRGHRVTLFGVLVPHTANISDNLASGAINSARDWLKPLQGKNFIVAYYRNFRTNVG